MLNILWRKLLNKVYGKMQTKMTHISNQKKAIKISRTHNQEGRLGETDIHKDILKGRWSVNNLRKKLV